MLLGSSDGWGHIPLLAGPPTSQAPRHPGPGQRPSYLGCVFLEHLPQATVGPPLLGVLWDQTRSARHKATEESAQPARWDRGAQRCRTLPGGEGPQGKPRATPVLPWHAPKPTPTAGSLTAVHTPRVCRRRGPASDPHPLWGTICGPCHPEPGSCSLEGQAESCENRPPGLGATQSPR